jgi:hypothetical protein
MFVGIMPTTQSRRRVHGPGSLTVGQRHPSLQAVDHGENDRIREPFGSQYALEILHGHCGVAVLQMLLELVINKGPREVVVEKDGSIV